MAKKQYEGFMLRSVPILPEGPILEGSYTMKTVKVGEVAVNDYAFGFSEDLSETDFGKDLTFD